MNAAESVEIGNDLALSRVEDYELIGIHVREIQSAVFHVEALVVKSNRRSRHGNIRNRCQHGLGRSNL